MKYLLIFNLLIFSSCFSQASNKYENAKKEDIKFFKKIIIPFHSGTKFYVHQGAFGKDSHNEKGNEYSWDMDVPFNTKVIAVESGKVIQVWAPKQGGGCDPKYFNYAHNIKIQHKDGTVAQYVHIKSNVKEGQNVRKGDVIAITSKNGWICRPHLHFGIYKSVNHLYNSLNRKTIPLYFIGTENGILKETKQYIVP